MTTTETATVGPALEGITGELQHWEWGQQYGMVRELDDDRYVAVVPFLFTWGLIWGHKKEVLFGHSDRWCYKSFHIAFVAATVWDGTGDPPGNWIKHPLTGRRRDENGAEYVDR